MNYELNSEWCENANAAFDTRCHPLISGAGQHAVVGAQ